MAYVTIYTMKSLRKNPFAILRVAFGIVWGIDAAFKWTPAFLNGLPDMIGSMISGQPQWIASWLNFWLNSINFAPHVFAILIALIESALAIGLIFNFFPRFIYSLGFVFSLFVWSIGEAFGGPYTTSSTDIGVAVMYAFVFAALYFEKFNFKEQHQRQDHISDKVSSSVSIPIVKTLSVVIIFLIAIIISPYFVTRTSSAQQTDMPPGMVMKTFYIGPLQAVATDTMAMNGMNMDSRTTMIVPAGILASTTAPIPTVDFTLLKDTLDGWDLHIATTNFTWTPQNINQTPIADEGHAHLYIDGNLTVLFAPWYHIDGSVLFPGKHAITVSLNANDHSVFSANGKPVQMTKTLFVSPI